MQKELLPAKEIKKEINLKAKALREIKIKRGKTIRKVQKTTDPKVMVLMRENLVVLMALKTEGQIMTSSQKVLKIIVRPAHHHRLHLHRHRYSQGRQILALEDVLQLLLYYPSQIQIEE